jgi:hypothetical protein
MVMCHHQNTDQNHNVLIAEKAFERVAKFKYLGTVVTGKKLHSHGN